MNENVTSYKLKMEGKIIKVLTVEINETGKKKAKKNTLKIDEIQELTRTEERYKKVQRMEC